MCENFANVFSTVTAPALVNNNEYVPITNIDTKSWKINGNTLVCCKPGSWQFTSQYQLFTLNSVDSGTSATIEGWFNLNGKNIANSAASGYASKKDGSIVLTICHSGKFKKGDKIKFGIRSVSTQNPPVLNIVCKGYLTTSGVYAPSLIVTAIKI